jgi:uroporphyrin-III C-methyltransferase
MAYRNPAAECIYIGKRGHRHHTPQEQINRMLVEANRAGKQVVRLKGGDPFVFGRGGEEAEFLADHGISFEVVPGVTSAVAAPAYAGIPVTHRSCAASVAFVTGHRKTDGEEDEIQVPNADTLVYLMGVSHVRAIAERLIAAGRNADTPAAVVQWGTRPTQRTVTGTVATIADVVERERIHPPAVLVVGEVVRLREKLDWFERERDADAAALEERWETRE